MSTCISFAQGSRRQVIDLKNGYVLKCPKDNLSESEYKLCIDETKAEIEIWRLLDGHVDKKYFVPIVSYDPTGLWVIMPKGEPISKPSIPDHQMTWIDDVKKAANWVRIDGKTKVCDYGQVKSLGKLKQMLGETE